GEESKPMPFTAPELILEELPPGVEIVAPAGLTVGGAIPVPAAVQGRWITIGAGPDQDIVLRDQPPGISRSHCRLTFRGGAFLLRMGTPLSEVLFPLSDTLHQSQPPLLFLVRSCLY